MFKIGQKVAGWNGWEDKWEDGVVTEYNGNYFRVKHPIPTPKFGRKYYYLWYKASELIPVNLF